MNNSLKIEAGDQLNPVRVRFNYGELGWMIDHRRRDGVEEYLVIMDKAEWHNPLKWMQGSEIEPVYRNGVDLIVSTTGA